MTAEEQKTLRRDHDQGPCGRRRGQGHRHDQEVFAFAKELADKVGIGGPGGDLSGSGPPGKSRRLFFKGLGAHVAARMLPDGTKALAPSGATIVGQEFVRAPVALGQVGMCFFVAAVLVGAASMGHAFGHPQNSASSARC